MTGADGPHGSTHRHDRFQGCLGAEHISTEAGPFKSAPAVSPGQPKPSTVCRAVARPRSAATTYAPAAAGCYATPHPIPPVPVTRPPCLRADHRVSRAT
jgi:hypothetical protein